MAKETSDFNSVPSANRLHISFFGRRNAGKSSLVNAVTSQSLSIVSNVKGTTTDPVKKAMELLPIGPVLIIDTPGIDDYGLVGSQRVRKTQEILAKTDVAILVISSNEAIEKEERDLIEEFEKRRIPFIVAMNKTDLLEETPSSHEKLSENTIFVSALTGEGVEELKELIGKLGKNEENEKRVIGDLLKPSDIVVLVTPIDSSAPKGRMILPQMQAVRDVLDSYACCILTQVPQLAHVLASFKEAPKMVVTDSQAFEQVKEIVPSSIPLTSFSILFARFKGILDTAVAGAFSLKDLQDGDRVLISEGCTHHRQCEDIGTVKLPNWILKFTGKSLDFQFTSGGEFPRDLSNIRLVVHCGGCMLNEREVINRMRIAKEAGVSFTNYGTIIAYMNGILTRSLEVFKND